jgi:mono/diheme cytochrome c family protein
MKRKVVHTLVSAGSQRLGLLTALATLLLASAAGGAESPSPAPGPASLMGARFTQTDGAQLYEAICQGCHMPGGVGASGAGSYPALAHDAHLAVKGFPIARVLDGSKAMPAFKDMLSDEQIAAVVSYVRTHFGNAYKGQVSAADVKALRQ